MGMAALFFLLLLFAMPVTTPAQAVEGPLYKIPHHRRILHFLKGGDGAYYLMLSSSGSSGRFSRNGESAFVLHRFDQDLQRTHSLKLNRTSRLGLLQNAYAALPAPKGIAFIGIERDKAVAPPQLILSELTFQAGEAVPELKTRLLAPIPGHTPGITNPNLRLNWSPDSAYVALSWRALSRPEDNSLAVLWLSRDLEILKETPAFPMKKFRAPVNIRELALDGYGNLIIQVQTTEANPLYPGKAGGASGFVFHERERDSTSKVIMAPRRMIPLSMATCQDPEIGLQWITGIYAAYEDDSLEVGLYKGLVSWEETMNFLETWTFSDSFSQMLVNRFREKDQQLSYRRMHRDLALGGRDGAFSYLLMLSGGNEGFFKNRKGMVIQTMLSITPDGDQVVVDTVLKASQAFHEEFRQMVGYGRFPFEVEGREKILLLNDFAQAQSSVKPYGYQLKFLAEKNGRLSIGDVTMPTQQKDSFTILSVQHKAPGGEKGEWVFPARFRNNLRLVKLAKN